MVKKERIARVLVVLFVFIAVLIFAVGWLKNSDQNADIIQIHARMPENGGWSVTSINAETNQPIHLKLTSDDVVHGFAIGKTNHPAVDIFPGEFVETTLLFDKPGTYTFYCTRWCGVNHWRMRGTIDVRGEGDLVTNPPPAFLQLGIDIDAEHEAEVIPANDVSPQTGSLFADDLPSYALDQETYFSNSPAKLWMRLRAEPTLSELSDQEVWDTVAWIWQENTSPSMIATGQTLYAENCAACHGETGKGDGVMVRDLPKYESNEHSTNDTHSESGMGGLIRPHDFTDANHMLGASPALFAGKIIRGGMGTGMPYWGPIFTEEQINALVSYIYTFAW